MSNHDRHLTCYFGILNLKGLMGIRNADVDENTGYIPSSEIILPLYSHETYKIKTTFNRKHLFDEINESPYYNGSHFATIHAHESSNDAIKKYDKKFYQKFFRRDVMWDFGDGTKVEGYNVEHYYKKPGRYKITCTFFDIDRKGWVNDYCIYVIVKEVLPTVLRFDKNYTKSEIKCSKVERIARLEALNSNTITKKLDVIAQRIFTKEQYANNFNEINKNYHSVKDNKFGFMEKYWTFLENQQTLFYNSNEIHSEYLKPSDSFKPKYNEIFGKFFYNEYTDKMDLALYQVIPYKNIDDNLKTISIIDPNSNIIDADKESWKNFSINQVYTTNQLPHDVVSVGYRGWLDLFYKNDFEGDDNVFSLYYDIETENITGELDSAPNYLNINPLGFKLKVVKNNINDIRIGYSLDGFLRQLDGEDITSGQFFIDSHLYNTLFIGIDLDTYMFPYIPYGEKDDFKPKQGEYYIPKDANITITPQVNTINGGTNNSYINLEDYIQNIHRWFYRIPLVLRQYINIKYDVLVNGEKKVLLSLVKTKIPSPNKTVVPKELQQREDIDRLLDVYMSHPMWNGKKNVRDMFKALLSNGYLDRIMTTSHNFLDDTNNIKRCFLSNLISTLQMMGEDVTLFESGSFEGINDLRDFVRLLSMNHTELIGHVIEEGLDIRIKKDLKGKNVGEEITVFDELKLNTNGKIKSVNNNEVIINEGVDLIVHDKYTNDTKVISFTAPYHDKNFPIEIDEESETILPKQYATPFKNPITIGDYEEWWGWNLLLPDSFKNISDKIVKLQNTLSNYALSRSTITDINNEIKRLKKVKSDLIQGYYSFHLLNPQRENVRIGNFIDDDYLNSRIESITDWEDLWGITHEILMKIFIEHGFLQNNRGHDYDKALGDIFHINIIKKFENKQIDTSIKVNGTSTEYNVSGSVKIEGDILDRSGNLLKVTLDKGIINDRDSFSMIDGIIECFVDDLGDISTTESVFDLTGNRINGKLYVKISGNVKSPVSEIRAEFNYNPAVTKSSIDKSITISSPVYLDDVPQSTMRFIGDVNLSGEILGVGDNILNIGFTNGTITYNNEIKTDEKGNRYDNIILEYPENDIKIVVAEDGTIYQKIETFKVVNDPEINRYKSGSNSVLPDGMLYEYRTGSGEIRMIIGGTVDNISITVAAELFIKSPDFIKLPTEDIIIDAHRYNFELEPFRMYSNYERRHNRDYREIGHRISDVILTLTNPRYDYNKGRCYMDGTLSFKYSVPVEYNNGVYSNKTYLKDYYTNDSDKGKYAYWSTEQYSYSFSDEFEFDNIVGDMVKPVEKIFTFDGNKITGGLKVTIDGCIDDKIGADGKSIRDIRITIDEVNNTPLRGVYVSLFDIDTVYSLKTNESQTLQQWGCKSITVKNAANYPCYMKAGNYSRNNNVNITVTFNGKGKSTTAKYSGSLSNIKVGQDGSLVHGDMVFNISGYSFGAGEEISGTITVGVENSQYVVKSVNLKYNQEVWILIGESASDEDNNTYDSAYVSGSISPSKTQVSTNEEFDLILKVDMLKVGAWSPSSWNYNNTSSSEVRIRGVYIDQNGVVNISSASTSASTSCTSSNNYQTTTANSSVGYSRNVKNNRTITFKPSVSLSVSSQYTRFGKSKTYYWSSPSNPKNDYPANFKDNVTKNYNPIGLSETNWLSVCGDKPHFKAANGLSHAPEDEEKGGFTISLNNVILQHPGNYNIKITPITTIMDWQLTKDNNKDNVMQNGDTAEGAEMPISVDKESISCYVSSNGYVSLDETEKTIIFSGTCFKEFTDVNDETKKETYDYEMSGYFSLSNFNIVSGGITANIDETKEEPLKFIKKKRQTPEIYVVYDNNNSQVIEAQLNNLINGESMFYNHTTEDGDDIDAGGETPDIKGEYNRIPSKVSFANGLTDLASTTGMFEECALTSTQVKGILTSLMGNKNNGKMTIGIHSRVEYDDKLLKEIQEKYDGNFNWSSKKITLKPINESGTGTGNTWEVTLKPRVKPQE